MNVIKACQDYFNKMITDVVGMKVLLLDSETAGIVSVVYTKTDLLKKDVYLVDLLDKPGREKMMHLKAVVFVRPTAPSLEQLVEELRSPKYSEYHVAFSNIVQDAQLRQLAESDEHEAVHQVVEMYADFFAVNRTLFSLNLPFCASLHAAWDQPAYYRTVDGIVALLLALKKKPVVRYSAGSDITRRLANDVATRMERARELFSFRRPDVAPVLLILDRRDDPVTPLLHQWTYQGMVHELLGIQNNRVSLKAARDVRKDMEEVVLSQEYDSFFDKHMDENFGDLGVAVKTLVVEYEQRVQSGRRLESIADMKAFLEQFPEFRKVSTTVSKHVAVLGELSRVVDERQLMDISELEQVLACDSDHDAVYKGLVGALRNPRHSHDDVLKAVILYCLRFEQSGSSRADALVGLLRERGVPEERIALVDAVLMYAGAAVRAGDLFGAKSVIQSLATSLKRGLQGIENALIRHVPSLYDTLKLLLAAKLPERTFPFQGASNTRDRPAEVIVFITGGVTFSEAVACSRLCRETPGLSVMLGGSTVHSSTSFLADVARFANMGPAAAGPAGRG